MASNPTISHFKKELEVSETKFPFFTKNKKSTPKTKKNKSKENFLLRNLIKNEESVEQKREKLAKTAIKLAHEWCWETKEGDEPCKETCSVCEYVQTHFHKNDDQKWSNVKSTSDPEWIETLLTGYSMYYIPEWNVKPVEYYGTTVHYNDVLATIMSQHNDYKMDLMKVDQETYKKNQNLGNFLIELFREIQDPKPEQEEEDITKKIDKEENVNKEKEDVADFQNYTSDETKKNVEEKVNKEENCNEASVAKNFLYSDQHCTERNTNFNKKEDNLSNEYDRNGCSINECG